jgi:ribosomal protein L19E
MPVSDDYISGFKDGLRQSRIEMKFAFLEFEAEIQQLREQLAELREQRQRERATLRVVP